MSENRDIRDRRDSEDNRRDRGRERKRATSPRWEHDKYDKEQKHGVSLPETLFMRYKLTGCPLLPNTLGDK